jgi:ribose 5-phosphate isomerase RpiB
VEIKMTNENQVNELVEVQNQVAEIVKSENEDYVIIQGADGKFSRKAKFKEFSSVEN